MLMQYSSSDNNDAVADSIKHMQVACTALTTPTRMLLLYHTQIYLIV